MFKNCKLYNGVQSDVGKIGVACNEEFKRLMNLYKIQEKFDNSTGPKPEKPQTATKILGDNSVPEGTIVEEIQKQEEQEGEQKTEPEVMAAPSNGLSIPQQSVPNTDQQTTDAVQETSNGVDVPTEQAGEVQTTQQTVTTTQLAENKEIAAEDQAGTANPPQEQIPEASPALESQTPAQDAQPTVQNDQQGEGMDIESQNPPLTQEGNAATEETPATQNEQPTTGTDQP